MDQFFNIKMLVIALVMTFLFVLFGFKEVEAVPYYITLDNLYDDGQFEDYTLTPMIPDGWENVYDFNLIENSDFQNYSTSQSLTRNILDVSTFYPYSTQTSEFTLTDTGFNYLNTTGVGGFGYELYLDVDINTEYTFSYKVSDFDCNYAITVYIYSGVSATPLRYGSSTGNGTWSYSFTTNAEDYVFVRLYSHANNLIGDSATVENMQIELGSIATSYIDYQIDVYNPVGWTTGQSSIININNGIAELEVLQHNNQYAYLIYGSLLHNLMDNDTIYYEYDYGISTYNFDNNYDRIYFQDDDSVRHYYNANTFINDTIDNYYGNYTFDTNGFNISYHLSGIQDYTNKLLGGDRYYFGNFKVYDLTSLFGSSYDIPSALEFNDGLENHSNNFYVAEPQETGFPSNAIYFAEESRNMYFYDDFSSIQDGDVVFVSFDLRDTTNYSEKVTINGNVYSPTTTTTHHYFTQTTDEDFKLMISSFDKSSPDPTHVLIDNIMVFNLTELFGDSYEPTASEFENDYLSYAPSWFTSWEYLLADVVVASQGDLEIGTISKDTYLKDYSYLYLGYLQEYDTLNLVASEEAVIENCSADILLYNTWFDLNANENTCELDSTTSNYQHLLHLLQDGTVKSDLENDTWFRIQYDNTDALNRDTQIAISFDEIIYNVRTVVIAFADETTTYDFDTITYIFRYNDFIVGFEETPTTNLTEENVIVLNIYNTLMRYDSVTIIFNQESGNAETDFSLTELAFLKDTLITTPIGNRTLEDESGDIVGFVIDYNSCGQWDVGCHIKNGAIWLIMDSPLAEEMWAKYGELFNATYDITRTQKDLIETLNQDGSALAIVNIVGFITALLWVMFYSFIKSFFK